MVGHLLLHMPTFARRLFLNWLSTRPESWWYSQTNSGLGKLVRPLWSSVCSAFRWCWWAQCGFRQWTFLKGVLESCCPFYDFLSAYITLVFHIRKLLTTVCTNTIYFFNWRHQVIVDLVKYQIWHFTCKQKKPKLFKFRANQSGKWIIYNQIFLRYRWNPPF